MHFAQVIHTANQLIHIAPFADLNVKKSTLTNTALSAVAMNAPKRKVHGKSKNVFKEEQTMKKSEAYNLAQIAVVLSPCIAPENKLEVLRTLMEAEDIAKFCEKQEETENAETV